MIDYHLNSKEQTQIERIVPLHQAKIHLAFRSNINLNKKHYENCVVALSEHMVILCNRTFIGNNLKSLKSFHLFDIIHFETLTDELIRINLIDEEIEIISSICMKFSRNLLRNFILSNPMLPGKFRFPFICHDNNHFPPFNPPLSPSQNFQFTYNAYCSFFETTYFHEIPMYFHQLLTTGNAIFDLSKLPLHIVESGFGKYANIRSITSSLMFCPYIYGFICSNFSRPDIIKSSAIMIKCNPNIRILRLVDTNSESGAKELSQAIKEAEHSKVLYWDLSYNTLNDFEDLAITFSKYNVHIRSFKFDFCNLNDNSLKLFFGSLCSNQYLYDIEQLSILGNKITYESSLLISKYLNIIGLTDNPELKILRIGPVININSILLSLISSSIQLTSFSIIDTNFDENSINNFKNYLKKCTELKILQLDGSIINLIDLIDIIDIIGSNPNIESITLSFSKMNLNGKKLYKLYNSLVTILSPKLLSLTLDLNKMDLNDLTFINYRINEFSLLIHLSLAENFHYSMKGIGSKLCDLLNSTSIESLDLHGNNQYYLDYELIPFLCQLFNNKRIKKLNISQNNIKDLGLETLINLLKLNLNFTNLIIDGNNIMDLNIFENFFILIFQRNNIINLPFPIEDIYNLILKSTEKEKKHLINLFSSYQNKLEITLMKNRSLIGLHSDLSLLNDYILNSIIDTITLSLQDQLIKTNTHEHLAITHIIGLPLPFEKELINNKEENNNSNELNNPYVDINLLKKINEGIDITESSMKTLQFNSLCIRRPNALSRLEKKSKIIQINSVLELNEEEEEKNTSLTPSTLDLDLTNNKV